MRSNWLACLLLLAGCPDVSKGGNDGAVPVVEFDPLNAIIPFPNNLVVSPTTGKVNLPAQACESGAAAAVRTGILNKLDGFGTFEAPMTVTLTDAPDPATVDASVHLYKRTPMGSTTAVPTKNFVSTTVRLDPNDCTNPSPLMVPELVIVPAIPLDGHSTYTLAITDGLKTTDGKDFKASFVWGLVRQSEDPVTIAADGTVTANRTPLPMPASTDPSDPSFVQLAGIDTLWQAHAAALAFLDTTSVVTANRENLLVATDFNTQTTTDPLDPNVANSPASKLTSGHLAQMFSAATAAGAPCDSTNGCTSFLTAIGLPCGSLPCAAVGDVLGGGLIQGGNMYQQKTPNPFSTSFPIPGAWTDPVNPMVQGPWQKTGSPPAGVLEVVAIIPKGSGPFPTVVFQHGLTRSKEDVFAIASQLAAAGFATVAIDAQLHGSRAIPVSNDPQLGCAGTCYAGANNTGTACDTLTACGAGEKCVNAIADVIDPVHSLQCYYPVITPNLDATRDSLRQTALDQMLLVKALVACGASNCTSANNSSVLAVQGDHIVYMGQSLGTFIGALTVANAPAINASVLNVAGIGIVDVLETTQNQKFRASYVNGLIAAGVLMGPKCDPVDPAVGLCANQDWMAQPAYPQFSAIERWVYDPGEPGNYVTPHPNFGGVASKKFLQQEVIGDMTVPNPSNEYEGKLLGQMPMKADPMTVADSQMTQPPPSAAITTGSKLWVQYPTLPADAASSFPGNLFDHGSLLAPTDSTAAAALGTLRMQVDAITYLFLNK